MLQLLPHSQKLRMDEGAFTLSMDTCIAAPREPSAMMRAATSQLRAEIASVCGVELPVLCGPAHRGDISLTIRQMAQAEGYSLCISPAGVRVLGGSARGLLYGVQTLRQIIRQCGWTLPALTIEDAPVFGARGFYHDVTRGRVPTMAWLRQLADECCFYKLNQLQLYVEHTYLFRDLTELRATAVTPLTAEEIMELDDYCAARGIELVPSLSSFGHLLELLRTKRFSHLCELLDAADMPSSMPNRMAHHTIDPTNPESLRLIKSMLDEFMPLFRSDKFNICADETFDLGRGRSAAAIAATDEKTVYIGFVRALCEHVASRGRTPMFWGDIVVKFADALKELPQGTICLNWGYSANEKEDNTRTFAQAGATQYVCPGVCGWNQWMPRIRDSHENIRRMAAYGVKHGALGLLNTDWGDYGHINDPRFSLPGLIFGACASWTGEMPDCDALLEQISHLAYGDASGRVGAVLADLALVPAYSWWHIVRRKDLEQGTLRDPWNTQLGQAVDDERFQAGQRQIAGAECALRDICRQMDLPYRGMIAKWLVAAEAIRLWDAAYHALCRQRKDASLAQALERWLTRYEAMWREVSKESELWLVRDVTVWYAAQLR